MRVRWFFWGFFWTTLAFWSVVLIGALSACGGRPEDRTLPHQCFTSECTKDVPPCSAANDLAPECKAK